MRDLTDQPVRREHRPGLRARPEHRRVRDRPGRHVRHDVGRLADQVHEHPEGRRPHRLPRRADAAPPRSRRSTPASTAWSSRAARAAGSRARRRCRRWCCCRWCAPGSTCRSSPPAGSSTARRWPPPSPSAPRACRWAPGWCRPLESPVHDNWKQAIVAAAETDTLFLNERHSPALRALRTVRTTEPAARRAQRLRRLRRRPGALLRRRHGSGHRPAAARWPGASTRSARSPTSSPTRSASSARRSSG